MFQEGKSVTTRPVMAAILYFCYILLVKYITGISQMPALRKQTPPLNEKGHK